MKNTKRFRSCYIAEVVFDDDSIWLIDTAHERFHIDKNNVIVMNSFVPWFKNIYLLAIPQTLTIVDYSIIAINENECIQEVNKVLSNPDLIKVYLNKDKSTNATSNEVKETNNE